MDSMNPCISGLVKQYLLFNGFKKNGEKNGDEVGFLICFFFLFFFVESSVGHKTLTAALVEFSYQKKTVVLDKIGEKLQYLEGSLAIAT